MSQKTQDSSMMIAFFVLLPIFYDFVHLLNIDERVKSNIQASRVKSSYTFSDTITVINMPTSSL